MKATTFKITPEGDIICLYDEDSPVLKQGKVKVVRASNVLFDEDDQKWFVEVNFGGGFTSRLTEKFEKRSEAIAYEIEVLNKNLADGVPFESHFES